MTSDPLGSRVDYNVSAMLDGSNEVAASTKGVVNNEWDFVVVGYLGNGCNVQDLVLWVGDRLDVDGLGLGIDGLGKVLWVAGVDKARCDSHAGEQDPVRVGGESQTEDQLMRTSS